MASKVLSGGIAEIDAGTPETEDGLDTADPAGAQVTPAKFDVVKSEVTPGKSGTISGGVVKNGKEEKKMLMDQFAELNHILRKQVHERKAQNSDEHEHCQ
ncbi:hypothetical protein DPMN_050982 [Dreissena polymorpha]|uniref:Uncharacterized protein n=1 Tax=Dreissena polymorpha TaxID=45954 RepID=A0A9D4CH40_DREPO|nr:hypothetical protein DPMN_050982 [Dreissena polymorpha]